MPRRTERHAHVQPLHRRHVAVAVATAALGALAACGGASRPATPHAISAGKGTTTAATLVVSGGMTTLHIRSADLSGDLYRASTPDDAGIRPVADRSGSTVDLQLVSAGHSGASSATILLDRGVHWRVRVDSGVTDESVNFASGGLTSLLFAAGASSIDVVLPAPTSTESVREAGGASAFAVSVPQGTAARVTSDGGSGGATIEGATYSGIAGGRTFSISKWEHAANRYDIGLVGGVSSFELTARR